MLRPRYDPVRDMNPALDTIAALNTALDTITTVTMATGRRGNSDSNSAAIGRRLVREGVELNELRDLELQRPRAVALLLQRKPN